MRRALQQSLNVPAVLALEKVGPQRFISTLRNAGVVPGLPPGEAGATLGVALGSATVSPLEMAGLYAGLANGGKFAPPAVRRDRPRPQPVQLIGPTATWYVGDVLAGAPLPDGFAALPVALRDRRIAFKTGTSAGFRDAWAAGYSANWTVVVWVGHADGTPRPGQLGRLSALPVLFKAFSRLPAEDNRAQPAPADVLRVASYHELPLRMRTLGPGAEGQGARASPTRRPMPGSSWAAARPCGFPPWAAKGGCAGWSTAARSTAPAGCPTVPARCAWRWSTRPAIPARSPCASSSGARRQNARASATDATSNTANATLIARLVRGSRKKRVRAAPASSQATLTAVMMSVEHRHLGGDVERQALLHQHEAREQRRHGGVALGIDQRQQQPADESRRAALGGVGGQRRRHGDAPGEIKEVGRGQHGHDRRCARHGQQQADQSARDNRHDGHHADDDAGEIGGAATRAEGRAGGGKAQGRRAGAAGQRDGGEEESRADHPSAPIWPRGGWRLERSCVQAAALAFSACATLDAGSRPSAAQISRPALAMASRSTPCSMPRPFIR